MSNNSDCREKNLLPENIQNKPQTLNSIIFCGGEKGGVGKSFLLRIMVDYFINKKWQDQVLLIDADPNINDIADKFGEDNCKKIIFSDNKFNNNEPDIIINKVVEKTIITNLPANVSIQFNSWINRLDVLSEDFKCYYSEMVYFFVCDGCFRSVRKFIEQINFYENRLPHCLVLNPGRLTCGGNFDYLQEYIPLMETLKLYEVPIIYLPEVPGNLQFKCDQLEVTYREALEACDTIADKRNINIFLNAIDKLFDTVFIGNPSNLGGLEILRKQQAKTRMKNKLPVN